MKHRVAILGSTGSIGTQSLEVARNLADLIEIDTLTACNNWELLVRQALEFKPNNVVIANKDYYKNVSEALKNEDIKIYCGQEAIEQIVTSDSIDTVIASMVGYAGLIPTINAIKAKKKIALANKETLVVAGDIIMGLAQEYEVPIIPVDSEHSAIFQCLVGEAENGIDKLIITASGGAFRDLDKSELDSVTPEQALKHPNWNMGQKVTIDSATMVNKGLEVIEARWLFNMKPSQIEVLIHPQSIVHSMVQFCDGAFKAQLGVPDMRVPIQYALTFPYRFDGLTEKYDFTSSDLTFSKPDLEKYPCLKLAFEALDKGGNSCAILNGANEIAVDAFLKRKIKFTDIAKIIEKTLEKATFVASPSIEDYMMCNNQAREIASQMIK